MSVMVAGGDEVVGLGEGMFTKGKMLWSLSRIMKILFSAGAAVSFSL